MHVTVEPVPDGVMRLFPTTLFPDVSDEAWERHPGLVAPDGLIDMPFGAFVARGTDNRIVLLDAGGGPEFVVPEHAGVLADAGHLLENLARLGIRPEDVTDVVLSHLHLDHIGWTLVGGEPCFPRAVHHVHRGDLDHFLPPDASPPDERIPPRIGPLGALVRPWDGPSADVAGVRLLHTPGHTPGSVTALVDAPVAALAIVGDIVHCPAEFAEDWVAGTDVDPVAATAQRHALADRFARDGTEVTGPHFPDLAPGTLSPRDGRLHWSPTPRDACHTPHL